MNSRPLFGKLESLNGLKGAPEYAQNEPKLTFLIVFSVFVAIGKFRTASFCKTILPDALP